MKNNYYEIKKAITQRVIEVMESIVKANPGLKYKVLAEEFSIPSSKISEMKKFRMLAGVDMIYNLHTKYGVSLEWLVTGAGEMFVGGKAFEHPAMHKKLGQGDKGKNSQSSKEKENKVEKGSVATKRISPYKEDDRTTSRVAE